MFGNKKGTDGAVQTSHSVTEASVTTEKAGTLVPGKTYFLKVGEGQDALIYPVLLLATDQKNYPKEPCLVRWFDHGLANPCRDTNRHVAAESLWSSYEDAARF